jgi:hypothetical protein
MNRTNKVLEILSVQVAPVYSSWIIKRSSCFKIYTAADFIADVLTPLVRAGHVKRIEKNKVALFSITTAGQDLLAGVEADVAPLIVAEPRTRPFVAWADRREVWPVAAARGDHRHIRGVGVAC